jgi:hypothetical protein
MEYTIKKLPLLFHLDWAGKIASDDDVSMMTRYLEINVSLLSI